MACFEHGTIIDLATHETVTLPDVRSAILRVTRGTLWFTQEGDPQDIVLRTGDTWVVERDGLTVVEAQGDVSFCVMGRRIEPLVTARRAEAMNAPRWWAKARGAAAGFLASPSRNTVPYF